MRAVIKKYNILHIVSGMDRGGAETFLMNLLRNIDRKQFSFIFLCYGDRHYDYEDEITSLGAKIVRIPDVKTVGIREHISSIEQVIRAEKVDIIHAHTHYNSVFSAIAARRAKVPVRIVHSHVTQVEPKGSELIEKTYAAIARILINIYATDRLACSLEAGRALFGSKNDVRVVRNGIEVSKFAYNRESRRIARKLLDISDDTYVIGHIGRFEGQKNHDFLIDIFDELQGFNKKFLLLLIGQGVMEDHIKMKVKERGLVESVKFLGIRSDIPHLMHAMDIFVFPSKYEGLGMVLIEAQAAGLYCLTSEGDVPKSSKLTDNLKFVKLAAGKQSWAKEILKVCKAGYLRCDTTELIRRAGYDVKNEVKSVEALYSGERSF